jgi:DoxX-like family
VKTKAAWLACWILRLLLAAFVAFVGYWKALGPIESLAEHHAWVAGFPNWFARAIGWSELACAAALLMPAYGEARNIAGRAAAILIVNQAIALGVHIYRGEAAMAAPQNLVLIALLSLVVWALRARARALRVSTN